MHDDFNIGFALANNIISTIKCRHLLTKNKNEPEKSLCCIESFECKYIVIEYCAVMDLLCLNSMIN